jgi:hypothetical protein
MPGFEVCGLMTQADRDEHENEKLGGVGRNAVRRRLEDTEGSLAEA